jgi:hypothetical protein
MSATGGNLSVRFWERDGQELTLKALAMPLA